MGVLHEGVRSPTPTPFIKAFDFLVFNQLATLILSYNVVSFNVQSKYLGSVFRV